jgi:hypothetical protein
MGASITRYEGRGRLTADNILFAIVLYSLEAWSSVQGTETILGSVEGVVLAELVSSTTQFVLHLETGATLDCTLQAMPTPGMYAVTAQSPIRGPRP